VVLACLTFGNCFSLLFWVLQGSSSESDNNKKLPFSAWAFFSTVLFGNIVIFYADSIAEERYVMNDGNLAISKG